MFRVFSIFFVASSVLFSAERVITLSPALTELVFQLGQGDSVVGTSRYSDFPRAARDIPKVGELFFPNIESVLKTRPTWILNDSFTENFQFLSAAKSLNLRCKSIRIDSVNALFQESENILKTVYQNQTSNELLSAKAALARWVAKPKDFRFLFFTWINPPILAASNTFFSNLFDIKGGHNLIPSYIHSPYSQVADEWLIQQKPDVVFILQDSEQVADEMKLASKRWWGERRVKVIGLNPTQFARTSLSPISGLADLEKDL